MRDEAMTSTTAASPRPERIPDRFRRSLRTVAHEAGTAFERTPLEVVLGAMAAIGFSTSMQLRLMSAWPPFMVTVGIALPLVYATSVLHARAVVRAPLRWGLSVAVIVAAALYGFFVFDPDLEAEGWRAFLLIAAAAAALLCVPLAGDGPGRPGIADGRREAAHRFIARLAARVAIVLAYAGALWVGLALALAAVNGLFELHLGSRAWAHLTSALFFLLPPWAVAAGLPALVAPAEPWQEAERKWFRRVGAFLVAPLVVVYLAIVYAYTVRVLGTGEVPKNLVSPVVIGAGLLIILATVALEPVHEDEKATGLSLLVRLSSPLLFPLVLFAIWAVNTRVDQYGWTEFRFLRLVVLFLLAAYGAVAAFRLFRKRRPPLGSAAPVLAVVLLLSAVGPWSAMAVARRSQAGELRALLAAAGRKGPGAPVPVPTRSFQAIADKARYLDTHFGWATLRGVAPWVGERPPGRIRAEQIASLLGIREGGPGVVRVVNAVLPDQVGVQVTGGTLLPFSVVQPASAKASSPGARPTPPPPLTTAYPAVVIAPASARLLVLAAAGDTLTADLAPLLRALQTRSDSAVASGSAAAGARRRPGSSHGGVQVELQPAEAVSPLVGRTGASGGQVVVRSIDVDLSPTAPPRIRKAEGFVILTGQGDNRR